MTDGVTGAGLGGITVTATGDDTLTTSTGADGTYRLRLPVGPYEVTAGALGFFGQPARDVEIVEGQTTTRDFTLDPVPAITVSATSLTSWQRPNESVARGLRIGNDGAADLAWSVDEDGSACGTTGLRRGPRSIPLRGA